MRVIIHLPVRLTIDAKAESSPRFRILHGRLEIETEGGGWHDVGPLSEMQLSPAPGQCSYTNAGTGGPSIHLESSREEAP